jgi:hypothetical protein
VSGKQRRPEPREATGPIERGPERQPPTVDQAAQGPVAPAFTAERAAALSAGQPRAERLGQALSVAPRIAELTRHLVATVERSALPDERKAAIRDRLLADQHAADTVSAAMVRAFGVDDPALRSALVDAARGAEDGALAEALAAHTGQPESAVRGLCDDLEHWVAGWWEEEDEEESAAPGDYAAEESGS